MPSNGHGYRRAPAGSWGEFPFPTAPGRRFRAPIDGKSRGIIKWNNQMDLDCGHRSAGNTLNGTELAYARVRRDVETGYEVQESTDRSHADSDVNPR